MPAKSKKTANASEDVLDISDLNPKSAVEVQEILRGRIFQDKFPAVFRGIDEQKR